MGFGLNKEDWVGILCIIFQPYRKLACQPILRTNKIHAFDFLYISAEKFAIRNDLVLTVGHAALVLWLMSNYIVISV